MARRAAMTIILLTRHTLVRADLGPRAAVEALWRQPRPDLPDLPSQIEAALLLGKPGRTIWVLSSDFWTQTLSLPLAKVNNLPDAEVARALNFEAETLSGLSAFEAALGQRPLRSAAGERRFWIVQVKSEELERIAEAVRSTGASLGGLLHPGGLQQPLAPDALPTIAERVELWPDAVIASHAEPGEETQLQVFNSDPSLGRWSAEVAHWQKAMAHPERCELLLPPDWSTLCPVDFDPLSLDDEAVLRRWVQAWSRELGTRSPRAPFVRPARRPLSLPIRCVIMAAFALLGGLLCGGHWILLEHQKDEMDAQRVPIAKQSKDLADMRKQKENLTTARDKLRLERNQQEELARALEQARKRHARLLALLASEKPEDLLIQFIDDEGGEPRVHGSCLQPEHADRFARALADPLRELGWDVQPPHKKAADPITPGNLWTFEMVLRETPVPATSKENKTAGRKVMP